MWNNEFLLDLFSVFLGVVRSPYLLSVICLAPCSGKLTVVNVYIDDLILLEDDFEDGIWRLKACELQYCLFTWGGAVCECQFWRLGLKLQSPFKRFASTVSACLCLSVSLPWEPLLCERQSFPQAAPNRVESWPLLLAKNKLNCIEHQFNICHRKEKYPFFYCDKTLSTQWVCLSAPHNSVYWI